MGAKNPPKIAASIVRYCLEEGAVSPNAVGQPLLFSRASIFICQFSRHRSASSSSGSRAMAAAPASNICETLP